MTDRHGQALLLSPFGGLKKESFVLERLQNSIFSTNFALGRNSFV